MAFGDLIKSARTSAFEATSTPNLGSNPASGNLLVVQFTSETANTISTPPTGFTLLHSIAGSSMATAWYYKVSVGTEQTTAMIWNTAMGNASLYAEYEWDGSTPDVVKNDDVTNISGITASTQSSGAATPSSSTNICIAIHGARASRDNFVGQAVDGVWIEDFLFEDNSRGGNKSSRLVNATGSQEATHTDTDAGLALYGAIATFSVAASAVIISVGGDDVVLDAELNAAFVTTGFTSEISTVQLVSGTSITNATGVTSTSGTGDFDLPDITGYVVDTVGCPLTTANNVVVARLTDA